MIRIVDESRINPNKLNKYQYLIALAYDGEGFAKYGVIYDDDDSGYAMYGCLVPKGYKGDIIECIRYTIRKLYLDQKPNKELARWVESFTGCVEFEAENEVFYNKLYIGEIVNVKYFDDANEFYKGGMPKGFEVTP